MAEKLLIVDDEPALIKSLEPILQANDYAVQSAVSGAEALRLARQNAYDIVLIDLGLPDVDGKELIGPLRSLSCKTIIVLSARHQESEKVAALDCGADDYLDKPFGVDELLARIRAANRRNRRESGAETQLSVENFSIDFTGRLVMLNGEEIKLTPKEYALLECLCRHAGQVVTRRQLLIAGWNDPTTDHQNLRVYMTLLRQKLEEDKSAPRLIATEAGVGYRFVI